MISSNNGWITSLKINALAWELQVRIDVSFGSVLHFYTLKAYTHGGIISDGSVNHPYSFTLLFFSMSLCYFFTKCVSFSFTISQCPLFTHCLPCTCSLMSCGDFHVCLWVSIELDLSLPIDSSVLVLTWRTYMHLKWSTLRTCTFWFLYWLHIFAWSQLQASCSDVYIRRSWSFGVSVTSHLHLCWIHVHQSTTCSA